MDQVLVLGRYTRAVLETQITQEFYKTSHLFLFDIPTLSWPCFKNLEPFESLYFDNLHFLGGAKRSVERQPKEFWAAFM